jgi:gas vesicle protein
MIFIVLSRNNQSLQLLNLPIMANTGKTIATLLIGAAVGAAVGYVLATDKDKRQENMDRIKDRFNGIKDRFSKKNADLEEEIYNA